MKDSNNPDVKKSKRSKDKTIKIIKIDNNCNCLVYYDRDEIVKSKMFYYPTMGTSKDRKKVDRILSKEYHLWLETLWRDGYLECDDLQFMQQEKINVQKDLTKENIAV